VRAVLVAHVVRGALAHGHRAALAVAAHTHSSSRLRMDGPFTVPSTFLQLEQYASSINAVNDDFI
jgi:hypothetical protein